MTKNIGYAMSYVIGGNMAGHDVSVPPHNYFGSRFGCLAVIEPKHVKNPQPDEDQVGELLGDGKIPWLNRMGKKHLSENMLANVKTGFYANWARAGKTLLKKMTPFQKQEIMRYADNVSNCGPVRVKEVWMFDKAKTPQLAEDGSNFFRLAKKVNRT